MDLRNILGKLDQINEGTMSSAKKKPTGPKFVGKMKGTDPASAAKDKYVGSSMEESIFKELEETLRKQPARDLKREFAEFKLNESSDIERKIHRTQALIQDYYKRARETRNDIRRDHFINMARQLESDLDSMINDANQAEQDSYSVAQHDAEPSATWNRGGLNEFAIDKNDDGDGRSKLVGSIAQLLKAGKKVDFYVPGIRGHVSGIGGQGEWVTLKRWNKPYSKINYSLTLDSSDDNRFALKMIKPDYYQVVEKQDLNQGVAEGYSDMMAKERKKRLAAAEKKKQERKLVKDRKTGKMYDPDEQFAKTMNSPEVKAQMKRMAAKEGVAEGYDSEELANEVYAEFERMYPNLARRADERTVHAAIMDVLNYGGDSDPSALAQDVARAVKRDLQGVAESFSDLERAVMEGGHELVKENPVPPTTPPAPGAKPIAQQPGKPTLGADLNKQQAQQQAQQQADVAKQQADAAKQAKLDQANLQKGVNSLKSAGAAISNPSQTAQAFNKVDANAALTPGDKTNIASAGTVLAPIMANQQLAGKFKDLVNQASAAEKQQQQQQQAPAQPVQPNAPVGAPK